MSTSNRRELVLFAGLLAAGLLVRLPFATVDFVPNGDTAIFQRWTRLIVTGGLENIYSGNGVNYSPLLLYLFGAAGWLANLAGLPPAGEWHGGLLLALLKLPAQLADVLTAALIAWALRPRGLRLALLACALYLFNPAIWLVATYWGQTDAVYALFMVVALLAAWRRALLPAWLAWTLAAATKLQSIALAPLLLILSLQKGRWRELAISAVACLALLILLAAPWIVSGHLDAALQVYADLAWAVPRVDVSGYNFWYLLLGGAVHNVSAANAAFGLPVSYQTLGSLAFGGYALIVAVLAVRRNAGIALTAAALSMGLFMLLTQIHERYLFPVPALLLLALGEQKAAEWRGLWTAYVLISLTFFYNLATIITFPPLPPLNLVAPTPDTPLVALLKALALLAALANTGVLIWLTVKVLRRNPVAQDEADAA